jgi:hypothetical protein
MTESLLSAPVAARVTPRWDDFPTPLNTAEIECDCKCKRLTDENAAHFKWIRYASKNGQMQKARQTFASLMSEWDSLGLQPDRTICTAFILQLMREHDFAAAMQVFDRCLEGGLSVSFPPRLYSSLFVGMSGALSDGPHAERILRVLRTVAPNCHHNRSGFVAHVKLTIGVLAREHRFVDAARLSDLVLEIALRGRPQELDDNLFWRTMLNACVEHGQAVQAIALWRVAARYEQCSSDKRDMLVLAVTKAVTLVHTGLPQLQHVVGWAADESLVPADWLRFVITDAVDGAGSQLNCSAEALDLMLSAAIKCKVATMALPLVRAALERPDQFACVADTFDAMLDTVASAHDRQLESLADSILTAARDSDQLSPRAVNSFMSTMIRCDRADKVLQLFDHIKTANINDRQFSENISTIVLAAKFLHDRNFAELARLYKIFEHDVSDVNIERQMGAIVHAAATHVDDAARFASTSNSRCYRIQKAARGGDFASALDDMVELPHHLRAVHFEFVVEQIERQKKTSVLDGVVECARQHDISWCKSVARVLVRLCDADALTEFVNAAEWANTSELALFRTELLNNLRDNGAQQLALMIKLLNMWVARGPVEADHASIVVVAAFRADAHNLGWQVYRTLMEKTQSLSAAHCSNVIRNGVRFGDELWAVMDEFEEHGVTMSSEVWTSAFDTIDKRMRSVALATQAFERMKRQQPAVMAASAYASAIGCFDALANVEAVLAHMQAAHVAPDASLFLAVLRFCRGRATSRARRANDARVHSRRCNVARRHFPHS